MNCPECGKVIKDGSQFCPYCGYKNNIQTAVKANNYSPQAQRGFVQPPAPQPVNKPPKKSGKKLVIAVAAVVLALAVAGASVFFLFFNKGENNDITAATGVMRTVRGRVNAEAVQLDTAKGLSLAVYAVTVDPETGRATVSSEPVAKTVTDENGEYEFELAPGNYIVQTEGDDAPTYRRSFIVPEEKETSSGDESEKKEPLEVEKLVTETGSGFDTGYIAGRSGFVFYNGVIYYISDKGINRYRDGDSELLTECDSEALTTNGEKIYFTDYREEKISDSEYGNLSWKAYDIYSMNCDGSEKKKVVSCNGSAIPILVRNNVLYYADYEDDFDGMMAEKSRHLYSYDLNTEERKVICDGVGGFTVKDDRIYFQITRGAAFNTPINCYDCAEKRLISDNYSSVSFYITNNTLVYFTYPMSSYEEVTYYKLNLKDFGNKEGEKITAVKDSRGNAVASDRFLYYDGEDGDISYRMDINTGDTVSFTIPADYYSRNIQQNGALFKTESEIYYLDNESDTPELCVEGIGKESIVKLFNGYIYTCIHDEMGLKINKIKMYRFRKTEKPQTVDDSSEIDYSSYVGTWSDFTEAGQGYMMVEFESIDSEKATFKVTKAGTHMAFADVTADVDGDTIEFEFTDSQNNTGDGTIVLEGDTVSLSVSVNDPDPGASYQLAGDSKLKKQ